MYAATFKSITGREVTAFRVEGQNLNEVAAWADGEVVKFSQELLSGTFKYVGIRITSHNGPQYARPGDWVVKDESQPFPCKVLPNQQFQQLYTYH